MSQSDRPPILAKASRTYESASRSVSLGAKPETILEEIRGLITDNISAARRLAARAASRFPEHAGITNAHRILNEGKATVGIGETEPKRDEEYEWLRHPPESARGQWVALLGSELVGMARSLAELVELLRSKNLERRALVHRLDG